MFADCGHGHDIYRDHGRARGIVLAIGRRGTRHGTGLSTYRWVVEPTFARCTASSAHAPGGVSAVVKAHAMQSLSGQGHTVVGVRIDRSAGVLPLVWVATAYIRTCPVQDGDPFWAPGHRSAMMVGVCRTAAEYDPPVQAGVRKKESFGYRLSM